jgi:hypothetical protein
VAPPEWSAMRCSLIRPRTEGGTDGEEERASERDPRSEQAAAAVQGRATAWAGTSATTSAAAAASSDQPGTPVNSARPQSSAQGRSLQAISTAVSMTNSGVWFMAHLPSKRSERVLPGA